MVVVSGSASPLPLVLENIYPFSAALTVNHGRNILLVVSSEHHPHLSRLELHHALGALLV
jgi:hypothetical protein